MGKIRYVLFIVWCLLAAPFRLLASADSVHVSLMTCAPGPAVYEQYGHTAIRYEDSSRNLDIVFNYGMFSFNTPNFVRRFVKGETDYQLGIAPYPYFEMEYAERGSSVYQQELNLTEAEKQRLFQLLEENYLPQNRTYRYNFFYDNCTTRARDMVERAVEGTVVYPETGQEGATGVNRHLSFRQLVHLHTSSTLWNQFGIDLLLGADADDSISRRQQQFAPLLLMHDLRGAMIQRGDTLVPLVKKETKVVDMDPVQFPEPDFNTEEVDSLLPAGSWNGFTPWTASLLFLIIYIGIGVYSIRSRRVLWWADLVLYLVQGVAGCVVGMLYFFSTHPTVGSNWLVFVFNPLPLLYLPRMIDLAVKGQKDPFHRIYGLYLTIFIGILLACPQYFGIIIVPLYACLWWNSWVHVIVYLKRNE